MSIIKNSKFVSKVFCVFYMLLFAIYALSNYYNSANFINLPLIILYMLAYSYVNKKEPEDIDENKPKDKRIKILKLASDVIGIGGFLLYFWFRQLNR